MSFTVENAIEYTKTINEKIMLTFRDIHEIVNTFTTHRDLFKKVCRHKFFPETLNRIEGFAKTCIQSGMPFEFDFFRKIQLLNWTLGNKLMLNLLFCQQDVQITVDLGLRAQEFFDQPDFTHLDEKDSKVGFLLDVLAKQHRGNTAKTVRRATPPLQQGTGATRVLLSFAQKSGYHGMLRFLAEAAFLSGSMDAYRLGISNNYENFSIQESRTETRPNEEPVYPERVLAMIKKVWFEAIYGLLFFRRRGRVFPIHILVEIADLAIPFKLHRAHEKSRPFAERIACAQKLFDSRRRVMERREQPEVQQTKRRCVTVEE